MSVTWSTTDQMQGIINALTSPGCHRRVVEGFTLWLLSAWGNKTPRRLICIALRSFWCCGWLDWNQTFQIENPLDFEFWGPFHWNFLKSKLSQKHFRVRNYYLAKIRPEINNDPLPAAPEAEFLFMDGFQIFLQNHERRQFSIWNLYFNQIGPKIKKWEQKIKKRVILNNTI
jgi:hypothetical protein